MLKRKAFNRIFVVTFVFILFLLISFFKTKTIKEKEIDKTYLNVYLPKDEYVVKSTIYVEEKSFEDKIKKYIQSLIKENKNNILLPDGFNPVVPSGTKILDVKRNGNVLKLYFNKELEKANEEEFEKILECLTYTALENKDIVGIEIYIENEMIKYIPSLLTKNIGINKKYEISSNKNIKKVVEFFYLSMGDDKLMLPVTKYVNDERETIEIVIDDLTSFIYYNDLISYTDNDLKLIKYEIGDSYINIYLNKETKNIDQIIYSVFSNYNIDKISLFYNDNKFLEKERKTLEK